MNLKRKLSLIVCLIFTFILITNYGELSPKAETSPDFKVEVTNVKGENYNYVKWTNLGVGYNYRVYQKGEDDPVYQSVPTKKSVKTLNIYPDIAYTGAVIPNTGLSGGQVDLDGKSVPDSGILKTWLLKEKIDDVKIDCVSLSSFNAHPEKYLKKGDGVWNYDSVFYGMWNLEPHVVYPSDSAVECLRTFINDGGGFMTSHHTIGYSGLDKGVNKLAKEMGVEIFANTTTLSRDASGKKYNTVSFEELESGLNSWQSSYWPSGNKVKIVKNGLLINYPFKVGKVGDVIDIPPMHGLSVFGTGDVWMNVVNPTAHNCELKRPFKEITKSPATGVKGTNNFYVHTYNNTAIINSGHSFPKITTAETRIIANTLYYLSQVTESNSCEEHKGQDVTAPAKPKINKVSLNKDKNEVNVSIEKQDDIGTKYDYYVEANEYGTGKKIKSDTKSANVTSGFKGYSIVVDEKEDTIPDNIVDSTSYECTINKEINKDMYVHVAAIDNAGNISETTTYKYIYPTLNLTASDLDTESNTVTIKAEGNGTQSPIKELTLPDGKTVEGSNGEFTVDVNGNYNFTAVDNEGNVVSKNIKIEDIPGNISLEDIKVNDDNSATTLKWSNSDKTQDYSYNINSKKSSETDFKSTAVKETTYVDNNAKDVVAPDKSEITNVTVDKEKGKTLINLGESTDKGTSYDYFIDSESMSGLKSKSEVKSATVASGLKGYSIVVDQDKDTVPDGTRSTTSTDYTFDKVYDSDFYVHVAAVDNAGNMSEVSTFEYSYPTLKLTPSTTADVKDKVTIKAETSKTKQIQKIITPDGKEVKESTTSYDVYANGTYTFKAINIDGNEVSESIKIDNIKPDVILNVDPNKNKMRLDENVTVDLSIDHITNIGAIDAVVRYDSSKLKFLGVSQVPGIICYAYQLKEGEYRMTFATSPAALINSKKSLLKLNFTSIGAGDAKVDVTKGRISSGSTNVLRDAECGETYIKIYKSTLKAMTLDDIFNISQHVGEDPEALLPELDLDLNLDGKIDKEDIDMAYKFMLQNKNEDM